MAASETDPWHWRRMLREEAVLEPSAAEVTVPRARGRILAAAFHSPEDVPALPVSAMDGFAVRRAELAAHATTVLPVAADLPARPGAAGVLAPGTAARIMTGAPVPRGCDLVVEVEATEADPHGPAPARVGITLGELPAPGRHIRGRGEEIARGDLLATPGERVTAGLIGLARMLGAATLPVLAPVRATVVVTGDELAGAEAQVLPGAVRESNGTMLAAALEADGCAARILRSGDDPAHLAAVLEEAADGADLVVTTGGIGHGAYDVVKELLGPRGRGSSRFAHLALRPGGPQGAGSLSGGVPVVHLPGTPVGALVGHHLFIRPLLPGAEAAPRTVVLEDAEGRIRRGRRRAGLQIEAGRLAVGADGTTAVSPLPGRRLAPFGRADALILGGAGADTGDEETASVLVL
ncbi:molybdopterin molybdotransferase MoeA [Brachybacterium sp. YJGR34]|uniref:molybdopterin molybdotransferase MoeA n=1 Tax=Brachybacterium sp. YJGR34 TaxID=2059911 RepID=UPI000E0CB2E9|nr:molybdopterin molybdotransferase MoeA [Brachybacterium sp. YJGR34]